MNDMDDITNALASKYGSGISLNEEKKKPEPVRETRTYSAPRTYSSTPSQQASYSSQAKLFPSERMELRSSVKAVPKRAPILSSTYPLEELEWMLATEVKRGWSFEDYCEVIGLPRDLHEKHDASMYGYVGRAFLTGKRAAHQR